MSQGACGYYVGLFLLKTGFRPPLPGAPPGRNSALRRVLGLLGGAADISVSRLKPTRTASSVIHSQNKTYESDVPWKLLKNRISFDSADSSEFVSECRL